MDLTNIPSTYPVVNINWQKYRCLGQTSWMRIPRWFCDCGGQTSLQMLLVRLSGARQGPCLSVWPPQQWPLSCPLVSPHCPGPGGSLEFLLTQSAQLCAVCCSAQSMLSLCSPVTVARQAPLPVDSPQEHWSGCPALLQGICPTQDQTPVSSPGR